MKQLMVISIMLITVVSCVPQIQLVTLKATDPELEKNNFVYQDSLITVAYDFYSPNGVIKFTIYNNYSSPVFIDWKNSLFIAAADKKYAYWYDQSTFSGTTQELKVEWTSWLSTSSGTLTGKIKRDDRITFLPPKTEVVASKFKLSNGSKYEVAGNRNIIKEKNNWKEVNKPVEISQYEYTMDNSPLNFRNYITISTTEDFKDPKYYDFGFWIAEIWEMNARQLVGDFLYVTNLEPTQADSHPYKRVDRFYVKEK